MSHNRKWHNMVLATLQKRDKKYLNSKTNNYEKVGQKLVEWGFAILKASGSFNRATGQYVLSIQIWKDCMDLEAIKNELLAIIPIMKPNAEGNWQIQIHEKTCSEIASYCIGYFPETNEWALVTHKHGDADIEKMASLDELIKHINDNYYWQEDFEEEDSVQVFINGDWWAGKVLETKGEEALVKFKHDTQTKGWFPFSKIKRIWF